MYLTEVSKAEAAAVANAEAAAVANAEATEGLLALEWKQCWPQNEK